jgi:hypothetical protein
MNQNGHSDVAVNARTVVLEGSFGLSLEAFVFVERVGYSIFRRVFFLTSDAFLGK